MHKNKWWNLYYLSKRLFRSITLFSGFVWIGTWITLWGNGRWWEPSMTIYLSQQEMITYAPSILAVGICASLLLDIVIQKNQSNENQ